MNKLFELVKMFKPKSNVFDLSHDVKLTMNFGDLVPTCVMEVVPGDKFKISNQSFVRFLPLVSPVMQRYDFITEYYFVANRLVNPDWEKFIISDPAAGTPAKYTVNNSTYSKLLDYMGIPPLTGGNQREINPHALAAYQMIWNEYYRDQNLIPETDFKLINGENNGNVGLNNLRKRAWEHDYFTSCLPFAQKGAAVDIPLGNVELATTLNPTTNPQQFVDVNKNPYATGTSDSIIFDNTILNPTLAGLNTPGDEGWIDPNGSLIVAPTKINDLRRAFKLQEWLEKNARAGTRYIENILAHFGVKSSDKRMQRPEYITGVKTPVVISEVLNTTGETGGLPQGNMAGHGIAVGMGNYGGYFCEEHGYIIGVSSIRPKTSYADGLPKHFTKINDPFEYYWPAFANIGEQAVKQVEVFINTTSPTTDFGYLPRYSEYRFMQSFITGEMRASLSYWTAARRFATDPALNQQFIECDPAYDEFAVTDPDEDHVVVQILHNIMAVRPMPKDGTPSF